MVLHKDLAADIEARIRSVIGGGEEFIPLHEPEFGGEEEAFVTECVRSGWVSSVGSFVDQFEEAIAAACGTKFGVALVNGTAALEVALKVAGVKPEDEVLMPSMTFVATANATIHIGAIPHFVDVEEASLGLDPRALRAHLLENTEKRDGELYNKSTGRRIPAIVPMHTFGHPVDHDGLSKVAQEFDLVIVEDAAEALGSQESGRPCGSLGSIAALSFNGNKILTTGGGGAIVTDDPELARRAKHLSTTAKLPHRWAFFHDEVGYNYRMPNLNAALGVAQLKQLDGRMSDKRKLADRYISAFADFDHGRIFQERPETRANYWLNTLVLDKTTAEARDTILDHLNERGVMARPVWEPLHTLAPFAQCPSAPLPATRALAARIINIPSSAHLGRAG